MFVDPTFEKFIQDGEINHASQRIHLITRDVELHQIIVTVQVGTFSFVVQQSMASTKLDLTHDGDAH